MTFDLVAPVYDNLARLVFGRSLLAAQYDTWSRVPAGARVLILGGGTGELLPRFLRERQPRHVLYLEASAGMLARARRRVPATDPVTFRHGTEATLTPAEQFDALLLPFVLDLHPEAVLSAHLIPRLLAAMRPGGGLYVTDFDQPRTPCQRATMTLMLLFFRLTAGIPVRRLPDWPAALRRAGLIDKEPRHFRNGQLRAGRWVRPTAPPAPARPLSSG